jgi:hypothetical protein
MAQIIDRYLQAVRFWLPKGQQDDITAELAEDLQSRIEEQQTTLGRKLDEGEIAVILKQTGSPVLVASRYRPQPQRSLIGPLLYPVYVFMLKMVALFYLLPWLLVVIGLAAFHYHGNTFGEGLSAFSKVAFTSIGAMTIVFALLERYQEQTKLLDNWDPRRLPAVRVADRGQIKRSSSIAEVIANLAVIIWWLKLGWFTLVVAPAGVHIVFAPAWRYFYWGLVSLTLLSTALSVANLLRPHWTRTRSYMRLALDIAGSALFCWVVRARVLVEVVWPHVSPARTASLVAAINTNAARSFPFAVAACVLIVVLADVPRLFWDRTSKQAPLNHRAYSL